MSEKRTVALIPEGRYRAKVVAHDMGKTSEGNPQVAVQFLFQDAEGLDRNINAYIVFTPKSMAAEKGCCHTMRQLGWDPDARNWQTEELGAKSESNPDGGVLVGREVDITIEHDEYKGKKQAKVAWINSLGLALKDRAETKEELSALGDLIRSMAKGDSAPAVRTGPAKGKAASEKSAGSAKGKNGVPF